MKNNQVSIAEERQHITKEFADTLAGKTPPPYFRLHDPVQKALVEQAEGKRGRCSWGQDYYDRMIHFWREVSLAGLPRTGSGMDECYALLFESSFSLAQAEPAWAADCLAVQPPTDASVRGALWNLAQWVKAARNFRAAGIPDFQPRHFVQQVKAGTLNHCDLVNALRVLYAPRGQRDASWENPVKVAVAGELWFWAAILLAVEIQEANEPIPEIMSSFHRAVVESAATGWGDGDRLHFRLIREAPQRALTTSRAQLMAHPILRLARLKYHEGSVEQAQVLRFLNAQCIKQGFESEEDFFPSELTLGQWVRDARQWAASMLDVEPEVCKELFHEAGENSLDQVQNFYREHLGSDPAVSDSMDAADALIRWAKLRRGFPYSQYRAQLWEFVVEIADAGLWLGWLFPRGRSETVNLQIQN